MQLVGNPGGTVRVAALLERVNARPFRRYTWARGPKGPCTRALRSFAVRIPNSEVQEVLWLVVERRDGAKQAARPGVPMQSAAGHAAQAPGVRAQAAVVHRGCVPRIKQQLGMDQYQAGDCIPGCNII